MRTRAPLLLLCISLFTASSEAQTVWHVDDDGDAKNGCTSWGDACPELQTALGFAQSGDQIWVAAGTYRPAGPGGDRGATFQLLNGVGIYGGFDGTEVTLEERAGLFGQTILSGDLNGDDLPVACAQDSPDCDTFGGRCIDSECIISNNNSENSYHVATGSGTDNTAILNGFAITAGNASGSAPNNNGGGLHTTGGSPTLARCAFSANWAASGGAGMTSTNNSNPTLTGCTFIGNAAGFGGGGLLISISSEPVLTDCVFIGNSAGNRGGGMNNDGGSSPVLNNCVFSDNSAVAAGGGLYNINSSNPTLTQCTFNGNTSGSNGGGMFNINTSSPILTACVFINNTSLLGGGMLNFNGSSPALIGCTFRGNAANSGGGMFNTGNSDPIVVNCKFIGNTAASGHGGGMTSQGSSDPSLTNSIFTGNSASSNGGAFSIAGDGFAALTNCTVYGNTAASGGGIFVFPSAAGTTVNNCIVWGNTPNQINGGPLAVTYSDVQGGFAGTGNIDADPLFVDPDGEDDTIGTADDNVRLSPGSLAIDSANNNAVPADIDDLDDDGNTDEPIPIDLDGEARFIDDPDTMDCPQPGADCGIAPIVDMGAYEFGVDCNENGLPDDVDIANETSDDCNANGVPDECELSDSCPGGLCTDGCDADCNVNCVIDSCDMDPADPDGDGEVSDDCNGNGIPDECDLDPLDPDGDGEVSGDCDENDIPDECDIASCPPGDASCDDCNLNEIPDGCDVDPLDPDGNGHVSPDVDDDGVPDECIEWDGESKENDLWSTAENWENDVVPGVDDPAILESVVIAGAGAMVVLDVNADIDGLLLDSDVTMQGTDGDLLVRDPTGVLKGNVLVKGDLQAGDGHSISAEGEVIIGPGGVYHSPPNFNGPISAMLEAGSITVQGGSLEEGGGGSILLTDGMRLTSNGDLQLEESEDDGKGGCKGSDTPPDFNSTDNAEVVVSGSFVTGKCARVRVNSSEALLLGGDFDNSSINPDTNTGFDWDAGALQMNGSSQTIEAAGEDRGPCPAGVNENFVIGTLTLVENAVVQVVDEIDNQRDGATACDEALYVGMLILEVGSELWTNGCRVYYEELMNDGLIPGLGTDVLQVESGCADMDGDGVVDAFDLASLLGKWGPCLPGDDCPADLSGDGVVDAFDLALLLGSWGPVS